MADGSSPRCSSPWRRVPDTAPVPHDGSSYVPDAGLNDLTDENGPHIECPSGLYDTLARQCVPTSARSDASIDTVKSCAIPCEGSTPICDTEIGVCRRCSTGQECQAVHLPGHACSLTGSCVECAADDACLTGDKPVCDLGTNTCRECRSDRECNGAPGVCMSDGHCANQSETRFVDFDPAGCQGADGSMSMPFCTPNDAIAMLSPDRPLIVLRGPQDGRLTFGKQVAATVVGKRDSKQRRRQYRRRAVNRNFSLGRKRCDSEREHPCRGDFYVYRNPRQRRLRQGTAEPSCRLDRRRDGNSSE